MPVSFRIDTTTKTESLISSRNSHFFLRRYFPFSSVSAFIVPFVLRLVFYHENTRGHFARQVSSREPLAHFDYEILKARYRSCRLPKKRMKFSTQDFFFLSGWLGNRVNTLGLSRKEAAKYFEKYFNFSNKVNAPVCNYVKYS